MKLSDTVNAAITERFRLHRPQSFAAKIKLIMSCDAISPYPSHAEARSLLSQRGARARKARKQATTRISEEERARRYMAARPDLYR